MFRRQHTMKQEFPAGIGDAAMGNGRRASSRSLRVSIAVLVLISSAPLGTRPHDAPAAGTLPGHSADRRLGMATPMGRPANIPCIIGTASPDRAPNDSRRCAADAVHGFERRRSRPYRIW